LSFVVIAITSLLPKQLECSSASASGAQKLFHTTLGAALACDTFGASVDQPADESLGVGVELVQQHGIAPLTFLRTEPSSTNSCRHAQITPIETSIRHGVKIGHLLA
jgi:hypothetical protein